MGTVKTMVESVVALWEIFGGVISNVLGAMLGVVTDVFGLISKVISGAMDKINGLLQISLGIFTGNWKKAWQGILNTTKGALKIIDAGLNLLGIKLQSTKDMIDSLDAATVEKKSFDVVALAAEVDAELEEEWLRKDAAERQAAEFEKALSIDFDNVFKGGIDGFKTFEDVGVSAFDKLNDATQRYVDTLKSQIDTFKTAFGIFDKPMIERISGERLLVRMEAQAKVFEKWQKALEVVKGKLGANSKLFQNLAQQGPQAAGQIIGLAGLSAGQLQQAEASFAAKEQISTQVATGLVGQQIKQEQSAPTVNLNGGVYVGDMAELANLIAKEMKMANAY